MRVDGKPIEPMTSRRVDYFSARIVGTQKGEDDGPTGLRAPRPFHEARTALRQRLRRRDGGRGEAQRCGTELGGGLGAVGHALARPRLRCDSFHEHALDVVDGRLRSEPVGETLKLKGIELRGERVDAG